jgi:hypothetical protein
MAAVDAERWLAENEFSESGGDRSPQEFLSNHLTRKGIEGKELSEKFLKT